MAKIMLVEDDNNLREIYGARLQAEGHDIVSAKDGEEALALAVKEKPDLIISDVMMPRISGFDMLDILRNAPETKDTKIIMMTALSQAEDRARADELGADRYLVKSQVTLEDVANAVREILSDADGATASTNATSPSEATTASTVPAPPAPQLNGAINPSVEPVAEPTAPAEVASTPTPPPEVTPEPVAEPTNATVPVTGEPATGVIANDPNQAVPAPPAEGASAPTPTPEVTPEPVAEPTPEPVAEAPTPIKITVDEAPEETPAPTVVMPPAIDEQPEPTPPEPAPEPVAEEPSTPPVGPNLTEALASEGGEQQNQTSDSSTGISNPLEDSSNTQKVIEPINDLTKGPDLDALLKAEEAKAQPQTNSTPPQAPPAPPATPPTNDPHSNIAL